jgi:sulfate-transporting ATPase
MVLAVCDEVVVLNFGRRIAAGSPAEVRADPAVVAAYIGTASQTAAAAHATTPEQAL